jgi:hypothetical protein
MLRQVGLLQERVVIDELNIPVEDGTEVALKNSFNKVRDIMEGDQTFLEGSWKSEGVTCKGDFPKDATRGVTNGYSAIRRLGDRSNDNNRKVCRIFDPHYFSMGNSSDPHMAEVWLRDPHFPHADYKQPDTASGSDAAYPERIRKEVVVVHWHFVGTRCAECNCGDKGYWQGMAWHPLPGRCRTCNYPCSKNAYDAITGFNVRHGVTEDDLGSLNPRRAENYEKEEGHMAYNWRPNANQHVPGCTFPSVRICDAPPEVKRLFDLCFKNPIRTRIKWVVEACTEELRQNVIKLHKHGDPTHEQRNKVVQHFHATVVAAHKYHPALPTGAPPQVLQTAVDRVYSSINWDMRLRSFKGGATAPKAMALFRMMYEICCELKTWHGAIPSHMSPQDPDAQLQALLTSASGKNVNAAAFAPAGGANRGGGGGGGWDSTDSVPTDERVCDWGGPDDTHGPVATETVWALYDLLPKCLRCFPRQLQWRV